MGEKTDFLTLQKHVSLGSLDVFTLQDGLFVLLSLACLFGLFPIREERRRRMRAVLHFDMTPHSNILQVKGPTLPIRMKDFPAYIPVAE